ncbi:sensor histidine kinase [Sphingomonas sp. RS2018]
MSSDAGPVEEPDAGSPSRTSFLFSRLPTGAKIFVILSAALLPLALIVVIAAFQTTRPADIENRSRLRLAAAESSRALSIELLGDVNALRSALRAIESDPEDAPTCARIRGIFAPATAAGAVFAIYDRSGTLRCGEAVPDAVAPEADGLHARIVEGRGLTLTVGVAKRSGRASLFFPLAFLAQASRPSGFTAPYEMRLVGADDAALHLHDSDLPLVGRRDRVLTDIGFDGVMLDMTSAAAPITSPAIVAMLLPVVMWVVASVIGWIVVDALLIRPLRRLQRGVGSYRPGTEFDPALLGTPPAQELRELGDTFASLSRTLVVHEQELAEGLNRQTKLTREVHHRVKNNLQVIASLISLHARSAADPGVIAAYATIQRRVDALAVVHRNHFAEMEVHRGLSLRSVIGELAANIRATAPDGSARMGITLELEPFLVNQDVAVAVAFLITEIVELAMTAQPVTQVRISLRASDSDDRAILRLSAPALIDGEALQALLQPRYGRILEGLSRQLRGKLHHDLLVGAFEIGIAVVGRD